MKSIKRFGLFEVRESISLNDTPYLEVVKFYPNPHYNRYNDFIFDEKKGMFQSKEYPGHWVSPSSFIHPECCITLMTMSYNQGDEPDYKSVVNRPIEEVSVDEYCDFKQAVQEMFNYYDKHENQEY